MYFPHRTDDRIRRTGPRTERAALAFIRIDLKPQQILADSSRTFLVNNMGDILIPEITKRGEYRIGCRLSEGAQ